MKLEDFTLDKMRSWDAARSLEAERFLRKEIAFSRITQATSTRPTSLSKRRLMKKSLARVLTVRSEKSPHASQKAAGYKTGE